MLTYSFENIESESMYEHLYRCIKQDILQKKLKSGEKLPSKRTFAKNLGVSTITVESAYAQLVAEGYLYTLPKRGYYVCDLEKGEEPPPPRPKQELPRQPVRRTYWADFVGSSVAKDMFPFSVWVKLLRDVTAGEDEATLLTDTSAGGIRQLRQAISDHLYQFRGMSIDPEQIVVGAGTEYLYSVLIQLLGRDRGYAMEDPGYLRLSKIYEKNDVRVCHIPMDASGIIPEKLEESGAEILHITPSHHFPTGIVMPVSRRYEFLSWASKGENRYIIEDDYDCEFRLSGRPIPTLQSIDVMEKVIYINTFSKSLAPAFRISYLVLPKHLVTRFYETLGFYSGTVSCLEQMTLARFLSEGYFEKHINRMRNHYRTVRDKLLGEISRSPLAGRVQISEENAGLHFLMEVDTNRSDQEIVQAAEGEDLRISFVSQYYFDTANCRPHVLVMNYSGLEEDRIPEAVDRLCRAVLE
ncbi:PLP-dependent aminotransferase family protein [Evtepia sp.]|uniref:MocR-like pyridoxine biosynthesis transcription factor PdxR n=1 Tax=Evtepia sp. TaxID=2773933 RepID=UPI002A7F9CEE|nr:PLP-dependent aminotransferase family protein [Evtepia sp.]MDY3992516.1 PLP-dependent aminotransferase family protein [Evtepia sp.]MDY4430110.1 PLP-dependent aminotransferase family protein [Evtepia sp.]